MKRGEIWWARLKPPMGERPVLLLSRNEAYLKRTSVTIAPVTTTIRGLPVEVAVGRDEGLPRPSVVNTDDVTTVRMSVLARRTGTVSKEKMREVAEALRIALDLPRYAEYRE